MARLPLPVEGSEIEESSEDARPPPPPDLDGELARAEPGGNYLFMSYARRDREQVDGVIDAARSVGHEVWTDASLHAGPGWAGEIVKAMKASEGVIVCCSVGAFESDHVKREVYLADRFKKRLLPVFLENIEPPDDFLYFFADRQWLYAHESDLDELRERIADALA